MKKYFMFTIIIISLLWSGCTNAPKQQINTQNNEQTNMPEQTTTFEEETSINIPDQNLITTVEECQIDFEKIDFKVDTRDIEILSDLRPIETEDEAIQLGKQIIAEYHSHGRNLEYVLCGIIHSTEDNIWIFSYSLDQSGVAIDELIDCAVLQVAIDGQNGTTIMAWAEE